MPENGRALSADALAAIIRAARARLRFTTEADLQQAIAQLLAAEDLDAVSQPRLGPHDRPDFMIGGLAVEVKVQGSAADLRRQVTRYAAHDEVKGIVVVTSRASHRDLPLAINGKPVRVAWLSAAAG